MPAEISAETIALLSKLVAGSKFQEAAKICERLTAASPDDARGWRTLLKCYVELGEFRRAFLTMDRMLERHPWEELYCFRTYFGVDGYLGVELQRRRDFTYFLLTVVIGVCIAEIGGRFGPIAALFSLAGCVVLALLVELGARARAGCRFGLRGEGVLAPFGKANPFVFYVADSQLYKYDDIFGFHYVAQQKWVQVAVGQDGIIDRRRLSSDRHGNLHPTDEEFESHTLNIAVIGDSFTAFQATATNTRVLRTSSGRTL
ncbi:MAG: tetratricopeptide repeat protein [Proteobacteria bacterium]|nr:tetratricopeptide repeat protein [Pseudomonadota bacterium]